MLSLVLTLLTITIIISLIAYIYYFCCLRKKIDTNMLAYSEQLV